ncbi:MAG: MBOAT family protein [Proteobacteria bacterium]|nr:MBOAT family protein [Pseudomonadota bacterium]
MLFNSLGFIFGFLPVCLICYHFIVKQKSHKIYFLIASSAIFYGFWDYRFLALLIFSIVINWCAVRYFFKLKLKFLIAFCISVNLLFISFFKYTNFFAEIFAQVFGYDYRHLNIVLPLGISFFTFQQIAYLIDVKRGEATSYPFCNYALHIIFFPHLIAGPIVRHSNIIAQFDQINRDQNLSEKFALGIIYFLLGLSKKVILADNLSKISDLLYSQTIADQISFVASWIGTIAFGFQIYFDFSGYSDMAIGLALMFGFSFPQNFNSPYKAVSIKDFWRRWHITLSNLIKDYLYIPLGGRKKVKAVIISMTLCGLWHGAGLGYVIWGFLHGLAISINNLSQSKNIKIPKPFSWLATYFFITLAWVFFRAADFKLASRIITEMFNFSEINKSFNPLFLSQENLTCLGIAALVAFFGIKTSEIAVSKFASRNSVAGAWSILFVFLTLYLDINDYKQFIYFVF